MVELNLSLLIIFIVPPAITAFYFKSVGMSYGASYIKSLVAALLLPIFLVTTKSSLLSTFIENSNTLDFIILFSYSILCSLAGESLINKQLSHFGLLKTVKRLTKDHKSLSILATNNIKNNIKNKNENEKNIFDALKIFHAQKNIFIPIPSNIKQNILKELLELGLIAENNSILKGVTYRITVLGIEYIKNK